MSYYPTGYDQYAPGPPPPVVPVPPPPSSFTTSGPHHGFNFDAHHAPSSPLVVPASPTQSHSSRASSQNRFSAEYIVGRDRHYLNPGGYGVHRSNSERAGRVTLERPRRGRSRSFTRPAYDDDDELSVYSASSYVSREPSRSRSRSRHVARPPRSPSIGSEYASEDDYEEDYSVAKDYQLTKRVPVHRPSPHELELTKKLEMVQLQLNQVQEIEKRRQLEQEQATMERMRNEEIERKVQEQIRIQKEREAEAARKAAEAAAAEQRRIEEAARKLIEDQKAAEEAKKAAEEAERLKIQAIVEAERRKFESAQQGKKTFTRFSKVHLCKEALDERNIPYTDDGEYFLVQRFVDKPEQKYLWDRTKEIRNYYRQIQEAAEKAPTVPGPDGGWVKYVQIAGQAYPIAIPVTIQQTPGGGQTQTVQPVRIKFTDIFKSTSSRR